MRQLALGTVLTGLVAALASGCGGGGGALSVEEYGNRLNAVCSDFRAKVEEFGEPASIPELAMKGPKLLDAFDEEIARSEDLKAPEELSRTAAQLVAKGKELRGVLSDLVDAAEKKDDAKLAELGVKAGALNTETNALARKLGAPACTAD
jgi:hypothetical protein